MKNNLLSLTKIEFAKFLSSFSGKGKNKRAKPILYVALFIGLLCVMASFGYSFLMFFPFVKSEIDPAPAIGLFAGVTSMFIFMTSLSQARTIYIGEDYDMLSALPLRKRDIVASKIISIYTLELMFSIIIMVPHGIMMIILAHSVPYFLISLLLAVTLPIVPITIAVFLSLFITMATARFKSANIVFVILYAILIVGISLMSMLLNNLKDTQAASGFSTMSDIIKWVNPSYIFIELSLETNKLFLLPYLGINLISAVISVLFVALFFDKLHEIVSSISMKKKYVRKDLKNQGVTKTLISLEFKRLINSKVYFINSIMGSIMGVAGSLVFLITFSQAMKTAREEALPPMRLLAIPIFIIAVVMILGLAAPTTGSINIEGKNFWLTKSLPTNYKKYMKVKLMFSWILTLPASLIASTIAVIFFHDSVWDILFAYLIPLAYVLLNSMVGLMVAINHPKLKWNNEAEAVKNSASVVISMLINFGCTIVFSGILIAVPLVLPAYSFIGYIISLAMILIAIIPCAIYLNKKFAKKISEIEDL